MQKILKLVVVCSALLFSLNAAALQKLTVILDWFPNPDHAPLFVAEQQGYFAQQGLDVDLVGPANASDPTKLVAAGKADIAITYQPQLLLDVQQGLPLVRIGTLVNAPLGCLIADKSKIKTLSDLKGKTIGYSSSGVDSAMLNAMLHSDHLSTQDVTLVNVNYDLVQGLLTHRVDAVTGVQRNFEMIELQQQKMPIQVFYPEKYNVPSYDEFIFVTSKNEANDPRLTKFLIAERAGEAYLQKNPQQSWELFSKNHPELNNDLNKAAWFATLPYFAQDPVAFDPKRYDAFMQFMVAQGLLKQSLSISSYTTQLSPDEGIEISRGQSSD